MQRAKRVGNGCPRTFSSRQKKAPYGAFLVLTALIIIIGSYLLQFICRPDLTPIVVRQTNGQWYKLAIVNHMNPELANKIFFFNPHPQLYGPSPRAAIIGLRATCSRSILKSPWSLPRQLPAIIYGSTAPVARRKP
jgi:hypothetical protein